MTIRSGEPVTATLYVLHSRAYRDTSAIITGLSEEFGKVTFVAKGIRSKKNAKIALLQPFVALSAQIYGRNELKNLSKLEALGIGLSLFDARLYSAMYLNELLMRLLPVEMPCPEIYQLYHRVLNELANGSEIEPVLREFEIALLQELGYGMEFHSDCITGDEIQSGVFYRFDLEQGFSATGDKQPNAISGQILLNIGQKQWDAETLKVAKKIVRLAMTPLLGNKPLKSRELFNRPAGQASNLPGNQARNE